MKNVKLVEKKNFIVITFDLKYETLIIHVALFIISDLSIYLFCRS